jgi:hypothetical protein
MSEEIPSFVSTGWFRVRGKGWVAQTTSDRERPRDNGSELTGELVSIDGEIFRCKGVERHPVYRPIAKGENIGLLVEAADVTMNPSS